ncbi:MAG: MotA/TolQ/ExbB proton channel family protein [Oligoflexia bacterium]|nr:MotA/TolQ/ExbB proton channel family protein [Oligoflexia bacterium]
MLHTIAEKFHEGGFFMYPIAVCSLFGIAIAAERFMYIQSAAAVAKDDFLNRINQHILQGNLERAIAVCSQASSPLTRIVKAGLMAVANQKDAEEVQTAMDAVALREIPKIERRTGLLAMLSNMATLLGLLGTIVGLIGAFGAVAGVSPAEKASLLANSISEAMNCTAFGLCVAIPLLGIFGFIQSRSQETIDDIHEAAVATLNFILANREKFARR